MSAVDRWGNLPLLADTSAWNWVARAPTDIQADFVDAVRTDQIRTSPIVRLELLYSTRNAAEFEERDEQLSLIRELPLSQAIGDTAVGALRDLKDYSDGYHRVSLPDALIAATAHERGYSVLHYDGHYDRLGEVLSFTPVRLAPTGSLT